MKNLANPNNVRILTYNKKIKVMTVEKITEKWGIPKFMVEDQNDILKIIISNISDVQQIGVCGEANDRLNKVKELIFDLVKVKNKGYNCEI